MDKDMDIKPILYFECLSTCVPMSGERKEGTADMMRKGNAAIKADVYECHRERRMKIRNIPIPIPTKILEKYIMKNLEGSLSVNS